MPWVPNLPCLLSKNSCVPIPSNVVPFWAWYGFLVKGSYWDYQEGATLEVLGNLFSSHWLSSAIFRV